MQSQGPGQRERVAIPRLPDRHATHKPRRVTRACDECRSRKAKCDARRPVCTNCARVKLACNYSEPKRDRDRTELEASRAKVDHYERVLRELGDEVDHDLAQKIKRALLSSSRSPDSREEPNSPNPSIPSSGGSSRGIDFVDEDINQSKNSRATGYHGKTSEISWIRSLETQSRDSSDGEMDVDGTGFSPPSRPASTASMNYRLESAVYPGLEADNIYALPSKELADFLIQLFMDSVHPSLPIIRPDLFLGQLNSFYTGRSVHPGRKWLAILNLIFAISTKLCLISGQAGPNTDHQYFSRAQTLNISECLVEDHEDLQQIQVEALAAVYLLSSSHINRAWKMIGTAARSSIALGLHLQAIRSKLDVQALEARHKLWWSVFIMENRLSIMTGRASTLRARFLSVPPPLASEDMEPFSNSKPKLSPTETPKNPSMKWTLDQDQGPLKVQRSLTSAMTGTNELYFFHLADLILISHSAFTQVYSIDFMQKGWEELYTCTDYYNAIMLDWRSGLPDSMSFEITSWDPALTTQDAYRISLAMHYHSSRLILTRPCLTRKKNTKRDHSTHISRSRKDIEAICLDSALAMISLFPDEPNRHWIRNLPWWNVLHFLVQATTIFLINTALNRSSGKGSQGSFSESSESQPPDSPVKKNSPETVLAALRKALQWQFHLGQTDDSARRAFYLCSNCIRRIDPRFFDQETPQGTLAFPFASTYLDVPSDLMHQQARSRTDVPYSQFAGTGGFGYDTNMDAANMASGASDDPTAAPISGLSESGDSTVGVDVNVDMSEYLPDPEHVNLDEVLEFLA